MFYYVQHSSIMVCQSFTFLYAHAPDTKQDVRYSAITGQIIKNTVTQSKADKEVCDVYIPRGHVIPWPDAAFLY